MSSVILNINTNHILTNGYISIENITDSNI